SLFLPRPPPSSTPFPYTTLFRSTIAAMAAATQRADRFVGLHFFNPVPLMPLVEVVRTVTTSEETFRRAFAFTQSLGKDPVAAKRSEEHTSELQSRSDLVCRLLLE